MCIIIMPPDIVVGGLNILPGILLFFLSTLTAYIYGTKYDIHKRASALQTTRGLLSSENDMNFGPVKRHQIGP